MLVSVVTVSFNAASTIADTLQSVAEQSHTDIEHIIVDGGSTDDTQKVVKRFAHVAKVIAEPDRGLYDAMNKGWRHAQGDLVGWLNADDLFADPDAVGRIVQAAKGRAPIIAGGVDMVAEDDTNRVIRRYSSQKFNPRWLRYGYAPPHPGFYIRRAVLNEIGGYDLAFPLAADFDLIARAIYREKLDYRLVADTLVKMRVGGRSSGIKSNLMMLEEVYRSCKKNGIPTNRALMLYRYAHKAMQYLQPPTTGSNSI